MHIMCHMKDLIDCESLYDALFGKGLVKCHKEHFGVPYRTFHIGTALLYITCSDIPV